MRHSGHQDTTTPDMKYGVSREFKGCLKFKGNIKNVSKKFLESFKEKFQGKITVVAQEY